MSERKKTPLFDKVEIKELIELLEGTEVTEIEVESEGRRIRLSRGCPTVTLGDVAATIPASPTRGPQPGPRVEPERATEEETGHVVKAPIVGSFYRSPSPDAPPFVENGAPVSKGQVLCIIEAMKLMNEIESDISGTLRRVLVQNGESVEYGQPLFIIDPA